MMPSRKLGSSGAPAVGPRASLVKPAAVSAAYGEAVKVLSDDTMSQACKLLLSERDYGDNVEGKSDREKLLELYSKCHEAAKVIEREAPAELPTMPNAPAARAAAAARAQAKPLGKPTASMGVMPKRTMRRLPAPPPKGKRLKREESDSSSTKERVGNALKKPRLVPPQSRSPPPPAIDVNITEPPPSALNFLKKLNKEPMEKKKSSPRKQLPKESSLDDTAEASSEPTRKQPTRTQPTRTQPKRIQPSRASRK